MSNCFNLKELKFCLKLIKMRFIMVNGQFKMALSIGVIIEHVIHDGNFHFHAAAIQTFAVCVFKKLLIVGVDTVFSLTINLVQ